MSQRCVGVEEKSFLSCKILFTVMMDFIREAITMFKMHGIVVWVLLMWCSTETAISPLREIASTLSFILIWRTLGQNLLFFPLQVNNHFWDYLTIIIHSQVKVAFPLLKLLLDGNRFFFCACCSFWRECPFILFVQLESFDLFFFFSFLIVRFTRVFPSK